MTTYGGQIEFHRAKQKCREKIKGVASDDEFISKINQFISILEDGHTYIESPEVVDKNDRYLPIQIKVSEDYLFIQNTTLEFKKHIGKPILAINNLPINELLKKVKKIKPSENISGTYKNLIDILVKESSAKKLLDKTGKINLSFKNESRIVEIPYQTEIDFAKRKSKFEIQNYNGLLNCQMTGKKKNIAYFIWNGVISREIPKAIYAKSPQNTESNLSWPYDFLNLKRTGNLEKDIQQIPSLYEQLFLLLKAMKDKKSEYLIVDLRKNSGGMTPLIFPILYMLHGDKYLNFDFEAEYIKKFSPLLAQKWGFKDISSFEKSTGNKNGDYSFERFGNVSPNLSLEEKRAKMEEGYQGAGSEFVKGAIQTGYQPNKIVLLCSPKTFSAAYHLTYFLKRLGKTKIIGVASRQAGNSFMEVTHFKLPETKIEGSISNAKQILFKDNQELGKILKPDIEMKWEDYRKFDFDKNAEVLKAIEFIESN